MSGLSSFTMYRDDKGRMVVKDKYDFYRNDQPIKVGIVTKTLDAIGYPFESGIMWKIKSHTKRAIQTRSCLDPLLIPRMIWIKGWR